MVNDARADGGRCPRCGARCGCGGVAVLATHSVCARRAAFARAPSSPLRLVRPLAPAGADGGAVGAQKAARPSRRVRCAPPCCRLRPSFVGSGGGWSLGGALAIKKGANVARVPSLPARRRARARVRLRGKQRWGGLLAPSGGCAAAAPPPPPPVKCWGRGLWLSCVRCGGVAPAAAGAKKRGCLPYLTAVFLLSHLVTQSAQEMSPVMFRQVRPMSNRRSTP